MPPESAQPARGTAADCTQALPLIEGIPAEYLLADKAYGTNEVIAAAWELGMNPVIPSRGNRTKPWKYGRYLYQSGYLAENAFLDFKQGRVVATRYPKRTALVICQIRAMVIWTRLL